MSGLKQKLKNNYEIKKGILPKQIKKKELVTTCSLSGYQDSNLGPPAPKAGALTGLRYTPIGLLLKRRAQR